MMYLTTWTGPVSIFPKFTHPVQHILSVFILFFQSSQELRTKLSRQKRFCQPQHFADFPCLRLITPPPLLWHIAVHWGMNSCINLFFWFLFCDFFLFCLFTLSFLQGEAFFLYSCHNIEINIELYRQMHTSQYEPWSKVRLILRNLKTKIRTLVVLCFFIVPEQG